MKIVNCSSGWSSNMSEAICEEVRDRGMVTFRFLRVLKRLQTHSLYLEELSFDLHTMTSLGTRRPIVRWNTPRNSEE